MNFYIPPQLKRLFLAFAIFIFIFLLVRHFLLPDSFGELGPYRADALIDNAQVEMHYAGQQICFECHQDIEDSKTMDLHSEVHCETCHGPGLKHTESGEAKDIIKPATREFCGRCHNINAARRTETISQVDLNEHNIEFNCIECHNPHQPWEMKE